VMTGDVVKVMLWRCDAV